MYFSEKLIEIESEVEAVLIIKTKNQMRSDIIEKLNAPTIDSKIELIVHFIDKAKNKESNEEDRDIFFNYLIEKEKISQSDNYCVVGRKHALGCFVSHFVSLYIDADIPKQIKLLTDLLEYIKGFQPSNTPLLNRKKIISLIDLVSTLGLPNSFLISPSSYQSLRVYLIPYEHRKNNATYFPHLNTIASFRPKEGLAPEYIFIHELGHLLAFNLTADAAKVPDSFVEFNKQYNPNWKGDLTEIFADLFSIAAMMETEYAPLNPFLPKSSASTQNKIKEYFIRLIAEYRINIPHF